MTESPIKKKKSFRELAQRLKEIRQRPLSPGFIERFNDLMKKSEEELKQEEDKKRDRKIARDVDLETEL